MSTLNWNYSFTVGANIYSLTISTSNVPSDPTFDIYTASSGSLTVNSGSAVSLTVAPTSTWNYNDNTLSTIGGAYADGLNLNGVVLTDGTNYYQIYNNSNPSGPEPVLSIATRAAVLGNPNVSPDSTGAYVSGSFVDPTCFLFGTLITTTKGDIAVEELQIGDLIPTLSGQIVPVKWVGIQQFEGRFLTQEKSTVCFKEGSLGVKSSGQPISNKDLFVTASHAMVVHNCLVSSARLVNEVTVTQEATKDLVTVYHVDLGEHHAILANGAWTESFREAMNRRKFNNRDQYFALYPEEAPDAIQELCLPEASEQNLSAITGEIFSYVPDDKKSTNPEVHLDVDGEIVHPTGQIDGGYSFALPADARNIRLMSRTSSPLATGQSLDNRQLGYCITKLIYSTLDGTSEHHIAPHSPLLQQGFYEAEEQRQRWTKGNAVLPAAPFSGQTVLTIKGKALPTYLMNPSEQTIKATYQPKTALLRLG